MSAYACTTVNVCVCVRACARARARVCAYRCCCLLVTMLVRGCNCTCKETVFTVRGVNARECGQRDCIVSEEGFTWNR